MRVFRAPMRSREPGAAPGLPVQRALDLGLCGMGELSDDERGARRLDRFATVPDGAFVWTRDVNGNYFLGRIHGELRHDTSPSARKADLVHVRDCSWLPHPIEENRVPAATLATFARGGRNFQETHGDGVGAQTREIWRASPT